MRLRARTIKILLAGDTHGSIVSVTDKIDAAKRLGIQRIVILGDFGLWWGHEGITFLDTINAYAASKDVQVFAIGGNHECWELWEHMIEGAKAAQQTSHGWAYIRTHVLLAPKVHTFKWGGKSFAVAGGAVSIDKDWRLEYERHKGKKVWSPNEQLSDADVESLQMMVNGPVDYLLTHDQSDNTEWKHRLKPDIDSKIHRKRIDEVIAFTKPKMHFAGHFHEKYDWINSRSHGFYSPDEPGAVTTHAYGLCCNDDRDSWGVLDISADEFVWETDM